MNQMKKEKISARQQTGEQAQTSTSSEVVSLLRIQM